MPSQAVSDFLRSTKETLSKIEQYEEGVKPLSVNQILSGVATVLTAAAPLLAPQIKWLSVAFTWAGKIIGSFAKEKNTLK